MGQRDGGDGGEMSDHEGSAWVVTARSLTGAQAVLLTWLSTHPVAKSI
jgi:hypothetical protein